ncbi:MAG: hypothetical protein SGPRY_014485, partial [Prymnesium sp.]
MKFFSLRLPHGQLLAASLGTSVSQVACGNNHSLAVTDEGDAWAWGCNAGGQLGVSISDSQAVPQRMSLPHMVLQVSAGYAHSVALVQASDGRRVVHRIGWDMSAHRLFEHADDLAAVFNPELCDPLPDGSPRLIRVEAGGAESLVET